MKIAAPAPLEGLEGTPTGGAAETRSEQEAFGQVPLRAEEMLRAQRALRASEERYRSTFEQAAVAIAHSSLDGDVRLVNQAFCLMTGYSRAEALRLHLRDLVEPHDLDSIAASRAKLRDGSAPSYQREFRLRRRGGSHLWADATTSLVRAPDGTPRHFVSVLTDVSERKRAEEDVNRFRAAMDSSADAIFLTDPESMRFLYVNETACRWLGYIREELLQKPPFELLGTSAEEYRRDNEEVMAAGERGVRTRNPYIRSDGTRGWTERHRRVLATQDGTVIITIAHDITERTAQRQKIERLSRVHAMLSGINAAIVRIRDRNELFRESCRIAHEAGGFSAVWIGLIEAQKPVVEPLAWHGEERIVEQLRRRQLPLKGEGEAAPGLLAEMIESRRPTLTNDALGDPRVRSKERLTELGIHSLVHLPLIVGGNVTGVMTMHSPVRGAFDDAEVSLLSELAANISFALEHLEKSERATYLALYDELTGLANRQLLVERLGQFVHAAGRSQGKLALALLDVERLRSVNKSLGQRAGDALLRQVAERLLQAAGKTTVARAASNHFAIVLPTVRDRSDADRLITALTRTCFAQPCAVEGSELQVSARIGLAMFPADGVDGETLLANAETALRKAKATGERHVFYTPDLSEQTGAWLPLHSKLIRALERDEFILHYQPKVDAVTRAVVGLEALIRWQNPELGLVPPAKFVPLMEETGMILEVGAWALKRAALDHRRWIEQGLPPLRVAVNVSPIQLRQHDFVQAVGQAIADGGAPGVIDLEITESLAMEDVEQNIPKLNELRALGVRVAIDDFGTGYSSLGYLAKLPVQTLKIDRSFISAMLGDPAAMTLVQTMISLAHALRLKVVAEGVEEPEQAKYLGLLRCDEIQGYLIAKPMAFDEVARFLSAAANPRK